MNTADGARAPRLICLCLSSFTPKEYNMHTPTKKILTVLALTALVVATAAGFGSL